MFRKPAHLFSWSTGFLRCVVYRHCVYSFLVVCCLLYAIQKYLKATDKGLVLSTGLRIVRACTAPFLKQYPYPAVPTSEISNIYMTIGWSMIPIHTSSQVPRPGSRTVS